MKIDRLEKGNYIVIARVKADGAFSLYTNHRRMALRCANFEGGTVRVTFAAALRKADFQKKPGYDDDFIELLAAGGEVISRMAKKAELPTVYTLGDSTVCDQTEFGSAPRSTYCGWGQTLPMYLGCSAALSNHAEQGTTTADCLNFHFKAVYEALREGDIVTMQFGHNDQKNEYLTPDRYAENLKELSFMVRKKGAIPVICSPINRLIYEDRKLNTYLLPYAEAAKSAAEECGAEFLDLHKFTSELYLSLGAKAEELFCLRETLDRTHMCDIGGAVVGEYAAKFIMRLLRD